MKAAGNSVLKVGKGVASVVADPEATAKGVGAGVKRFGTQPRPQGQARRRGRGRRRRGRRPEGLGRAPEILRRQGGRRRHGAAKGVLGVNAAYRRWAQKLQVGSLHLEPRAQESPRRYRPVDAAGGIAAKVVVPVPMVVGTTASVGGLVWGEDPEALLKMNEQRVAELGTPEKEAHAFFRNKAFALGYQTRFIAALHAVKVKGCGSYVDTAEEAQNERQVVFLTESAELLQLFHAKTPVSEILPDSRAVVAKTKDGRAVILLAAGLHPLVGGLREEPQGDPGAGKEELGASKFELQHDRLRIGGREAAAQGARRDARGKGPRPVPGPEAGRRREGFVRRHASESPPA